MNITIRNAVIGDNIKIHPLQDEIAALHHDGRPDLFRTEARYYSDDIFAELLSDRDQFIYIAESGSEIVGYAFAKIIRYRGHSTCVDFDMFYIDDICVLGKYLRHGIGRLLFEQCRRQALLSGCYNIDLGVFAFNHGAIAFYESCGMRERMRRMELILPQIRLVTATELPECLDVIHKSFATVAADFGLTRENCPKHTSFIPLEYLLNQYSWGWTMFGLYDSGRLAGYASLSKEGDGTYELHNLSVLPEHRHCAYGRMLLNYAKEKVRESGGQKIKIGIIDEGTVLKNWYTANGFEHTGTKKFEHLPFTVGFMEWSV